MRGLGTICISVPICLGVLIFSSVRGEATDYLFTVSCEHGSHIVAWRTGDIDPGKEWLRVATGTQNPNCSVSDFVASRDSDLPRETLEHEAGVVRGIPLIGPIVCSFFGC